MSPEDGPAINPLTSEILSAIMWASDLGSDSFDKTPKDNDFETLLAQFACGWVTDEERMAVIAGLTESEDHRLRLIQMRESLKSVAWDRLSVNDPVLANALTTSAKGLIKVYSHWKEVCARVFSPTSSHLDELRSIQLAMRRIDAGWSLKPVGSARTRGETGFGRITIQPGDSEAELFVEIPTDGSAIIRAELSSQWETEKDLSLYVIGPEGDWIFLGGASTDGPRWQLTVTNFADLLGSSAVDIQPSWLILTEGPYVPKRNTVQLHRSIDGVDSTIWLAMTKSPAVLAGEFSVGIDLPEAIRADMAEGAISVSIDVGTVNFPIGRWQVSALPNTRLVVLNAPLEGVEDGEIELESAIRFSFEFAELHG